MAPPAHFVPLDRYLMGTLHVLSPKGSPLPLSEKETYHHRNTEVPTDLLSSPPLPQDSHCPLHLPFSGRWGPAWGWCLFISFYKLAFYNDLTLNPRGHVWHSFCCRSVHPGFDGFDDWICRCRHVHWTRSFHLLFKEAGKRAGISHLSHAIHSYSGKAELNIRRMSQKVGLPTFSLTMGRVILFPAGQPGITASFVKVMSSYSSWCLAITQTTSLVWPVCLAGASEPCLLTCLMPRGIR